jgi:cyclophilin family peptidyl-prolyl cis-trans isomerase
MALAAFLLSVAAQAAGPERVRVTTNLGSFVIELQRDRAPLTVENFLGYVRREQYTNTLFHRVISGFLIQGGGIGLDYKLKPTMKPIPNEAGNGLKNYRGTVGLARASGPHTGDAQFFINVADNADLDPLPTRWGYAVFGKVVEGMEVVDRISVSPTSAKGAFKQDAPIAEVVIQKIEIIGDSSPAPATPAPTETPSAPPPSDTPADGARESAPAPAEAPPGSTPPK